MQQAIASNAEPDGPDAYTPEAVIFELLFKVAWLGAESILRLASMAGIRPALLLQDANYIREFWSERPIEPSIKLAMDLLTKQFQNGLWLHFDGKRFHAYDGKVWKLYPQTALKQGLWKLYLASQDGFDDATPRSLVADALKFLEAAQYRNLTAPEYLPVSGAINTQDAEVWFDEHGDIEVRPHRSWSRHSSLRPFGTNLLARCPLFDRALEEICSAAEEPEEMARHILEVLAYAVQPMRDIPLIIFFAGSGANGKSMLLNIWAALFDDHEVNRGKISRLSQDRFALPTLRDTLLFIDDDAEDGARVNDGVLKSIAEQKVLTVRAAHSPEAVSFISRALPVISLNGGLRLNDTSFGFERRMKVIPFERRFTEEEMDRFLGERIIRAELPGIFAKLVDAYFYLRQRGRFLEPEECVRAKSEMLSVANPFLEFLNEGCRRTVGARISTHELYEAFLRWCKSEGHRPEMSQRQFTTRLKGRGFRVHKANVYQVSDIEPLPVRRRRRRGQG
jgi:P4 family phage/plasmid primase-like protien